MHLKCLRGILMVFGLTALLTVGASAAYDGVATLTMGAELRSEPNWESEVLSRASEGDVVLTVEPAEVEGWYKVDYCTTQGYMAAAALELLETYDQPLCYGAVTTDGSTLNIRASASVDSEKLGSLSYGCLLPLNGFENGWFKTEMNGVAGYVSAQYVTAVLGDGTRNDDPTLDQIQTLRQQIVEYAKQFIGVRYTYGGSSPSTGFDCSGFTSYVYKYFGYALNRSSMDQLSNGTAITRDQLQPGDLVFWNGHVAMYVGNGQCIHAPRPGLTVRVADIAHSGSGSIIGYRSIL